MAEEDVKQDLDTIQYEEEVVTSQGEFKQDFVTVQLVDASGYQQFTHILSLFHTEEPDLQIICSAGEDGELVSVRTSRLLLAAASNYLMKLIKGIHESVNDKEDLYTLLLPDFELQTVEHMLHLLLNGSVNCSDLEQLEKLQTLTKNLKLSFSFLLPGETPQPKPKPILLRPIPQSAPAPISLTESDMLFYHRLNDLRKLTSQRLSGNPEQKVSGKRKRKRGKEPAKEDMNTIEYECRMCNEKVKGINKLSTHMKHHALKYQEETGHLESKPKPRQGVIGLYGKRKLSCDKCGESFGSRRIFVSHLIHHRLNSKAGHRRLPCNLCSKAFPHLTMLEAHKRLMHPSASSKKNKKSPSNLTCGICGKKLATKKSWLEHEATHAANKSKFKN